MWWKLALYVVYLVSLFLLSRLLEAVAYYEGGYLASRLLDPVNLSVRKLKMLLDQRGVSYAGVVEKQELTGLVEVSGEVREGELDAASMVAETATSTNFTCGTHFYEEVEDSKDSVWVVQVVHDHRRPFMQQKDWLSFVSKVSRFGVRTGIFDCSQDWRHCEKKKWVSSRLLLALPIGQRAKDTVELQGYAGSAKGQAVLDWVNLKLATRISEIHSAEVLKEDWLSFPQDKHNPRSDIKMRIVLFSDMPIPPMFYSVLSVKFSGRVKFGVVKTRTHQGDLVHKHTHLRTKPACLILTPEGNYTFGPRSGEYWNYDSMSLFFKTLHPEVNDIFLLSLVCVNMLCWFEVFLTSGSLVKRLGSLLWYVGKWNCLLILLWLPVLAFFQLPYMDQVLSAALTSLRLLGTTGMGACVRADWMQLSSNNCAFLFSTFLVFAAAAGGLNYYLKGTADPDAETSDDNNNHPGPTPWWSFNWETYARHLFRPISTLAPPMVGADLDMEAGVELLIERLAVPNFWLRPMISSQYISDLPVWRYTGPSIDSDIGSDTDNCPSPRVESDGEEGGAGGGSDPSSLSQELGTHPLLFTCEKCRALQNAQENIHKSPQQLEAERLESESACAKFLMDGNYKCMCNCHSAGQAGTSTGHTTARRGVNRRDRGRASSRRHLNYMGTDQPQDYYSSDEGEGESSLVEAETDIILPYEMHQIPSGFIATTECAICLESYKFGVRLCGLPCRHSFHEDCIVGWLTRDNHCCPLCRWPAYKAKPCEHHQHVD